MIIGEQKPANDDVGSSVATRKISGLRHDVSRMKSYRRGSIFMCLIKRWACETDTLPHAFSKSYACLGGRVRSSDTALFCWHVDSLHCGRKRRGARPRSVTATPRDRGRHAKWESLFISQRNFPVVLDVKSHCVSISVPLWRFSAHVLLHVNHCSPARPSVLSHCTSISVPL